MFDVPHVLRLGDRLLPLCQPAILLPEREGADLPDAGAFVCYAFDGAASPERVVGRLTARAVASDGPYPPADQAWLTRLSSVNSPTLQLGSRDDALAEALSRFARYLADRPVGAGDVVFEPAPLGSPHRAWLLPQLRAFAEWGTPLAVRLGAEELPHVAELWRGGADLFCVQRDLADELTTRLAGAVTGGRAPLPFG